MEKLNEKARAPGYARKAIAEKTIPYRPNFTKLTGKVTAAILLQQIAYYWEVTGGRPFYKFKAPCGHDLYREGDSWVEDLGFSASEFNTAIRTIGTKITKGVSKQDAFAGAEVKNLVIYWTDSSRVTWYQLNQPLFDRLTDPLYESDPKAGKLLYLESDEPAPTGKTRKAPLPVSENTPENTSKNIPQAEGTPVKPTDPGKRNGGSGEPAAQLPGVPTLEPDTPGAEDLFEKLRLEHKAHGRRAPTKFKTLAQKEKWVAAERLAGEEDAGKYVALALEKGILPLASVVAYVAKCASNGLGPPEGRKVKTERMENGRTHVIIEGRL